MICRLCERDRKLVKAHVIPRSFCRLALGARDPARMITNVPGRFTQQVPIGVYDPSLLCEECERCFSQWDDYGAEIFLHRWNEFQRLEDQSTLIALRLQQFDYTLLKMFFLSVLWRASASAHAFFRGVDLGPHEIRLRDAVRRGNPGDVDDFGIVLQAFDETNIGILNPDPIRLNNRRFWRFYLSHVIAFIKVDSRPFELPFSSLALAPNRPLTVCSKKFFGSPEMRVMMGMVVSDHEAREKRMGRRRPQ